MKSKQRTYIRNIFNVHNNVPILIDKGESYPPILVGKRGGYFTKGGTRILHPNAYAKCGWSNMQYITSSQKIYVGQYYLNSLIKE